MKIEQPQRTIHSLFSNPFEFIALLNQHGKIMAAHKSVLERYLYHDISLIGRNIWEIPWWSWNTETQNNLKKGIQSASQGEDFQFKAFFSTDPVESNNYHLFDFSIYPLRDPAGTFTYLSMEVGNFQGSNLPNGILCEKEEKYRTMVDNSLAGVYIVQDDLFRYVNKKFCDMIGYNSEEIIDKLSPMDLVLPDDRKKLVENFQKRLSGEIDSIEYALRVTKKDGQILFIRVLGSLMTFRGRKAISGTLIDITEFQELYDALRQSESKYRNIFENTIEGIFQSTPEGKLISVNSSMSRLYGYDSPEDMITFVNDFGKQVFVTSSDRAKWRHLLEKAGILEGFEAQFYKKDGSIIWCSLNARTVRDESGNIDYFEGTIEDVTMRKEVEEELKKKSDDLEYKSRCLEDMNTTLRVLLQQRDEDKRQLEKQMLDNVQGLVMPCLERLKSTQMSTDQRAYVTSLELGLENIISNFFSNLKVSQLNLTPREIEIAIHIKTGKGTKEISNLLHISEAAVERHRKNLRRKLGLKNQKVNLQNYLYNQLE